MPAAIQQTAINEDKMNAFLGKVVGDFGASLSSALVYLGEVGTLQSAGRRWTSNASRIGTTHKHQRALRAGMAR